MPSIFTNTLDDLNLFPETFLPGGPIFPTPAYTFEALSDGAIYTLTQPLASVDYHNINPEITVSGTALSVDSNGVLTGEIQAIGFRSDNRGEIGFITDLTINGPDLSALILGRTNGDATTGDQFLTLLAGEFNDLTLTSKGTTFEHNGFFGFIDQVDLAGGSDTFKFYNLRIPLAHVDGGTGNDVLDLTEAEAGYTLNMAEGRLTNGTNTLTFESFEQVLGGTLLNDYVGSRKADVIISAGRNDTIVSGDGADTIESGSGKDRIDSGNGHDSIRAGKGDDNVDGGAQGDLIWGNAGDDTIMGGDGFDTIRGGSEFDEIQGGNGRDKLFGQRNGDMIDGGNDNDLLNGGGGNDTLLGGLGDDELKGGTRVDILKGGAGNDLLFGNSYGDELYGGTGNDTLKGGGGDDRIKGASGDDILSGGADSDLFIFDTGHGADVITDFDVTEDTLRFTTDLTNGQSATRLVKRKVTVTDDGLLISFDDGDEILLAGLNDTVGLSDAIDVF